MLLLKKQQLYVVCIPILSRGGGNAGQVDTVRAIILTLTTMQAHTCNLESAVRNSQQDTRLENVTAKMHTVNREGPYA